MTMDATGLAALIGASVAAVSALIGGAASLYRFARAQAKADLLQEQSHATITAKDGEINELKAEVAEVKAENARLWSMLPYPQEKS
jgi:transposase-like protein